MSAAGLLVDVRNTLGHFHPALVHFPVALLLVAAAVEVWSGIQGRASRSTIGRLLLVLGTLGALGAVASGLSLFHPEDFRGKALAAVRIHRLLGFGTLSAAIVSLGVGGLGSAGPTGGRLRFYRILLVLTGLLAGLTGHYGGWVVFGWGRVWTF
jgi:uncharacterized membrane protein